MGFSCPKGKIIYSAEVCHGEISNSVFIYLFIYLFKWFESGGRGREGEERGTEGG